MPSLTPVRRRADAVQGPAAQHGRAGPGAVGLRAGPGRGPCAGRDAEPQRLPQRAGSFIPRHTLPHALPDPTLHLLSRQRMLPQSHTACCACCQYRSGVGDMPAHRFGLTRTLMCPCYY